MRLNTAHMDEVATLKVVNNVRKVSDRIALLLDTKGPEIRTHATAEEILLKMGDVIRFVGSEGDELCTREMVYLNYAHFVRDVPEGTSVLIDDGELELKVVKRHKTYLLCQAMNDGEIKSNKSVNIPDVHIDLPSLSKKDRSYIQFAIKHDLDFIAHSFVRNKEDILVIQRILDKQKSRIKIIAKIENREGVENLDEILDHAYGLMVARGDLGIEIPAEEIPLIQKMMIKKCIARHKPVITATQMLHTMIKNPRPTRAEVSDVANAILDGTDAIMLSGETANGDYPVEAVKIMVKIASQVETNTENRDRMPVFKDEQAINNFLAKSAVIAARELDIKEIIVCTSSGFSAEVIASYRSRVPMYVKCYDKRVARELSLTYGLNAHYVKQEGNPTKFLRQLLGSLYRQGKLAKEDKVVYLTGDTENNALANFMVICEVGKYVK